MSAPISEAVRARLNTRTSSTRPLKNCPAVLLPPIFNWPALTAREPVVGWLATSAPSMNSFTLAPSHVSATWVHVPSASDAGPAAASADVVKTFADGTFAAVLASSEYEKPPVWSLVRIELALLSADGRTQASSVIPELRRSVESSGTVTMPVAPSSVSAWPKRPLAVRAAPPTIVPLRWPSASTAVVPDASSKPYAATRPVLCTSTATDADVLALPDASRATAVRVCGPSVALFVSQLVEYGLVVLGAPRSWPSSLNWTLWTPTLSLAVAVTLAVFVRLAPAAGAVTLTVGAVVSPATTALACGEAALRFPALSAAFTR